MRYLPYAIALFSSIAFLWVWRWQRSRRRRLIARWREDRRDGDDA